MSAFRGSMTRNSLYLWNYLHQSPMTAINLGCRQMSSSEVNGNKRLDGKVAIITGAAGGIGGVVSKLFASHGAQVIMADVSDEIGNKKASEIGSNAHYRHCDVTKETDVSSTVNFAMEKFGKLDIMFNNVGVLTPLETLENFDLEKYDQYNSVLVRGVLAGIKHAARVMIPVKQGVILNTGSTASVQTLESVPPGYNICKSTFPGLTRVAAYHLGKHGIRVNTISPHAIVTPLVVNSLKAAGLDATYEKVDKAFIGASSLLGKRTTEEDIAKGALYLCSDDAGYVSGQNLVVDGNWCGSKEYDVVKFLLNQK